MFGIVYIISCTKNPKIVYVGSTVESLEVRFQNHVYLYIHWCETGRTSSGKISIYPFFDEYGLNNFEKKIVWSGEICDKKHLSAYEQLYINKYKAINKKDVLNGIQYGFFKKCKKSTLEYKGKKAIWDKGYRDRHSEKLKIKSKNYSLKIGVAEPCGCGGMVSFKHRTDHEKTKIHMHFIKTGQKLEKLKKIKCKCGSIISSSPSMVKRHEETLLHKNWLFSNA